MADYCSIIARAVSRMPSTSDEARHAIYEQARTALYERLGNDPQISNAELVTEHDSLEAAIHRVEEDLLLSAMRRFVKEETAPPSSSSFVSKVKEFVCVGRSAYWVKVKNPKAPAVTREAEEDWTR